jgi:tetratricopeptide (TPR) repeat protein
VGEVVAHELAHEVAWHHFTRQPPWFREGIATFVESVGVERADDAARTGSHVVRGTVERGGRWAGFPSPLLANLVAGSTVISAKELLEWRGRIDDADPGAFHARSWLLYHYLWNRRSKAFSDFEGRLAAGEDPAAAWRAAFPDLDPASAAAMARLDGALADYRSSGRYASYRVEVGAIDATGRERALSPGDVHMLLLDVRAPARWPRDAAERRAAVRAIVDEALREDPTQPEALDRRARDDGGPSAAALRQAVAARPDDPDAWLLLANALDATADAPEKEAALRRAVALSPPSAIANNDLAWLLLSTGRAREARPYAERAVDLEPWNAGLVDTLAAVAFGLGQCKAAVALQRRAVDGFPPGDRTGEEVRRRLAAYEARCAGAGSPAAPVSAPPR